MRGFLLAIEGGVALGCLFALVAIAVGVTVAEICGAWKVWRKRCHAAAMSALAAVAIIVGGTKLPALSVTWDEYFTEPRSATVDTNDLRRVSFAWEVASGVPAIATATLSAIEAHSVNPDPSSNRLFTVASVPMTNRTLTVMMQKAATNYLYWLECSFMPDAPVVTNVMYHLHCVGGENVWVPIGVKIYHDAELISPPSESFLNDLMKGNIQ